MLPAVGVLRGTRLHVKLPFHSIDRDTWAEHRIAPTSGFREKRIGLALLIWRAPQHGYTCKSFTNFLKAIIESVYISRGL